MSYPGDDYQGADMEALEDMLARFAEELPVEAPLGPVGREALG